MADRLSSQPPRANWRATGEHQQHAKRPENTKPLVTVVGREGAVGALEAIEGTDACIRRAGELTSGKGGVMVKVAKPDQDMRFDVPAIGTRTIDSLVSAGISVLGIEAGRTVMLAPQAIIDAADAQGVCIVGLDR